MANLIMIITFLLAGTAAIFDYKTRRIPNLLTLPALVIGLVLNTGYCGVTGLKESLPGLLVGGLLLLLPFMMGGMGAGDEVLTVGSQMEENAKSPTADTITLAVTPQEAQLVMLAENTGKIKLTLRPADDKKNIPMPAIKHQDMISQY